jgi:hypothetical protein
MDGGRAQAGVRPTVTVHHSPTGGCCTAWVVHLRSQGFPVTERLETDLTPVKRRLGVPAALESCHTALVEGYVIEGHVPADLIDRLLRERPKIAGLAVPGMPVGSPGMESPGMTPERYRVLTFDRNGSTGVFARR